MFRTEPNGARTLVEEWINRPALRELVEAYGGTWPSGDLESQVDTLAKFSERWDYRSGESRLKFHDEVGIEDPHAELTYRAALELGLMGPVPPSESEYDFLLILGGLATGVEPRVKYAAELLDQGLKITRQVAGLGSYRPLHERELEISLQYAPEGAYEIDYLSAMLAAVFFQDWKPTEVEKQDIERTETVYGIGKLDMTSAEVRAYSAASSQPGKRPANTTDTYDLFVRSNDQTTGATALLVTSAIYVPYQHLDAVHVLGRHGITVETVGLIPKSPGRHPAHAYRQEIRSAIRAAARCVA